MVHRRWHIDMGARKWETTFVNRVHKYRQRSRSVLVVNFALSWQLNSGVIVATNKFLNTTTNHQFCSWRWPLNTFIVQYRFYTTLLSNSGCYLNCIMILCFPSNTFISQTMCQCDRWIPPTRLYRLWRFIPRGIFWPWPEYTPGYKPVWSGVYVDLLHRRWSCPGEYLKKWSRIPEDWLRWKEPGPINTRAKDGFFGAHINAWHQCMKTIETPTKLLRLCNAETTWLV